MTQDVRELTAPWSSVIGDAGAVVQGVDALAQLVKCVVGTQRGSVPHAPDLGVDWLGLIDLPHSSAAPRVVREVSATLARWVPSAVVDRVELIASDTAVDRAVARVTWHPVSGGESRRTEVTP